MEVDLTTLPSNVLQQIPYSIRSYKSTYDLDELPSPIQYLIRDYFESIKTISYDIVFDLYPTISEYGDLKTLKTIDDVVVNYIQNFFLTQIGAYPFDATSGTKLKRYLHSKDTQSVRQLIDAEVQTILNVISADLGVNVTLTDTSITPISMGSHTEYNIIININLNNKSKRINIQIL